jgi:hypothetical protein
MHVWALDKSDRMVNSYGIARRTWNWTKKLFFHLLDMTILNAYLLNKSGGGKITQNPSARFDCTVARGEYHGQWRFSTEAKFIWIPTESTRGETLAPLAIQRETKTLSCVFTK